MQADNVRRLQQLYQTVRTLQAERAGAQCRRQSDATEPHYAEYLTR